MPIRRSHRRISPARMSALTHELLDASTLCAIASVAPSSRAYINTAYFAWTPDLNVVWLSEPYARHSRNIETRRSVAVAVYDSHQSWGKADRGIQLFGSAGEPGARAARPAAAVYRERFPELSGAHPIAYRLYRFRPRRVKLFDEQALGAGVFVTATVRTGGELVWERTEVYESNS